MDECSRETSASNPALLFQITVAMTNNLVVTKGKFVRLPRSTHVAATHHRIEEQFPRLAGEDQGLQRWVTERSSWCKREAELLGRLGARGQYQHSKPLGFISEYEG